MKTYKAIHMKEKDGFTVIEVLVAMTILVLAATCFLPLFVSSFQGVFRSGNKSDATYLAQKNAENKMATNDFDTTGDLEVNIGGKVIKMGGAMVDIQESVKQSSSKVKLFVPTIVVAVNVAPGYQMKYPYDKTIQVNIETRNVAKDAYATVALLTKSGTQISVSGQQAIVNNLASVNLNISNSLAVGDYIIRVHVKDLTKDYDKDYSITYPRFVAIGNNGSVNSSAFGDKWETTASGMYLNAIAYGNGRYIAVGNSGNIYSTQDGFTWNSLSLFSAGNLRDVIYNGSCFFAVGDAGTICYSKDGSGWSYLGSFTTKNLKSIACNKDGLFVAVGEDTALTFREPVGSTFTAPLTADPLKGQLDSFVNIDSGLDSFYALTTNSKVMGSTDGIIWTLKGSCPNATKIKWLGDNLFAIGRNGLIMTSIDGVNWTDHSFKINNNPIGNTLNDIVFGNTQYEIAGDGIILYSLDGLTWTAAPTVNSTNTIIATPYLNGIASSK